MCWIIKLHISSYKYSTLNNSPNSSFFLFNFSTVVILDTLRAFHRPQVAMHPSCKTNRLMPRTQWRSRLLPHFQVGPRHAFLYTVLKTNHKGKGRIEKKTKWLISQKSEILDKEEHARSSYIVWKLNYLNGLKHRFTNWLKEIITVIKFGELFALIFSKNYL